MTAEESRKNGETPNSSPVVDSESYKLLERTTDAVYTVDTDWNVTFWDSKMAERTGIDPEEVVGANLWKALGDAIPANLEERYRRVMETGEPAEFEQYLPDPFDYWVEVRVFADENGLSIHSRDVTVRRERRNRLRKFEQIVHHTGHAVFFTNVVGEIQYVNPAFERITGYTSDEVVGETPHLLNSGEHEDSFFATLWETVLDGDTWRGEIVNERKDGTRFVANHTIAPVTDDSGAVTHFVAIYDDITDRKEREERLRTHELVTQAMNEVAVLVDSRRRIRFANQTMLDFVDVTLEEIAGVPIRPVLSEVTAPREDPQRFTNAVDAILRDEEPDVGDWIRTGDGARTLSLELELSFESSGRSVIEMRFVPVELYDGERGVAVVSRDVTERTKREEKIRTHLQQAQKIGNVGSWRLDLEEEALSWSDECYRIFGIEPGQPMTYERFLELVHPKDREAVDEEWSAALNGEPYEVEHRIVVDDEVKWVLETAEVRENEDGEPVEGVGVVQDVTARKARERAIDASRKRYRTLLQSSPDPVFVANTKTGELIEANEAAESLRGQGQGEFVGTHQSRLHPPEERKQARELFERMVEQEGSWREYPDGTQIHTVTATGEKVPVEITLSTFRLPERSVSYAVFRDITEQLDREREIREQKRRIEALFDSIHDPIVVTDTEGRITNCNPGFTRLFGYELNAIEGESIETLFADGEDGRDLLSTASANEDNRSSTRTVEYRKKSGQKFPGESSVSYLRDHDENVVGYVDHIRDVSEREESRQQLQVVDRVLRHNVRNDMNTIMGYAEIIQSRGSKDVQPEAERIYETGQDFAELATKQQKITTLLTRPSEQTAYDIVPAVSSAITSMQEQHPDATVTAALPESCRVIATREIEEAVRELVDNAVVHSDRADPAVRVAVEARDDVAEIRVSDDGPGIPDPEWKVLTREVNIEPLYHGSGLGLWLVDTIVQRSDGTVLFEENDTGGSTVSIRLLLAEDDASYATF